MKKHSKVRKKIKMSLFEKVLYTCAVLAVVFSPISIVFTKATLSEVNFEVEKEKKAIEAQKKTNESLNMEINELASLTKIQEVAEEQGLSYNNNNIKTITEEEAETESNGQ
ncbi:MAG: cell division protein FtsL [Bacilli bacterium]|nr:cell division protein FtsL [Bacilli bacterium]